jgi:UPF0271 protein
MNLDLNCDLGEGCPHDAELMRLVTSASVACGFHAGGPAEAHAALRAARQHGVRVGAHPGFADREHFGRRELARTEEEVFEDCAWQIGALAALAQAVGHPLRYVKPHGALYHLAGRDDAFARPVVAVARQFGLAVMGLPGSRLQAHCQGKCPFLVEGFADRRYLSDGSLVPRDQDNAFVHDPAEAANQVLRLLRHPGIDSVCVHGDNPQALAFARALRDALLGQGVVLRCGP